MKTMRVLSPGKSARYYPTVISARLVVTCLLVAMFFGFFASGKLFAQQAKWIWNSEHISGNVPFTSVHFRKRFSLPKPVIAELVIAADDEFQVYFNSELVGYGTGTDKLTKVDLTRHLVDGENLLAIRATNLDGNTGAVAAIARFRLEGETEWRWLATDETWVSELRVDPTWKNIGYRDDRWKESQNLGSFGTTRPWDIARMERKAANQKPLVQSTQGATSNSVNTADSGSPEKTVTRSNKNSQFAKHSAPSAPSTDHASSVGSISQTSRPSETASETSPSTESQVSDQPTATALVPKVSTPEIDLEANQDLVDSVVGDLDVADTTVPASSPEQNELTLNPIETGTDSQPSHPTLPDLEIESDTETGNSNNQSEIATQRTDSNTRNLKPTERQFSVPENFSVQQILDGSAGSLIALEFNEFGQLVISREGGKLLIADLEDADNGKVSVRQCSDAMENVQGILPLNGDLYVTGDGPEGLGLYRLSDKNHDGNYDVDKKIVGFKGKLGEHGPHGLTLGPDGMLYIMIGNASGIQGSVHSSSPASNFYEGTVLPRMEDPAGHAAGVKAPGGTIVRISPDGKRREIYASGIRNSYDLAFNAKGDLFFHDSDMESDIGTPWYRPTQVFHATPGGEYGWRSGTAKFPGYFIDTIPGLAETGRGSPTGTVFYDHVMMPVRYHGALFLGDWSEGRILSIQLEEDQDSYKAEVETFLSAEPLTVTDLAIGPDGAIYFTTGGRGTEGGVYRVAWNGDVPDEFRLLSDQLSQLVNRPQPQSAWTRQELAKLKHSMGNEWNTVLTGILMEPRNDEGYRLRSLEIMDLFGPKPSDDLLTQLATDISPRMRERAIRLISWRTNPALVDVVVRSLGDDSPGVRRRACEALVHMEKNTAWANYAISLASESRTESLAARRLLESTPTDQWRDAVLESDNLRVFLQGATALMIVEPKPESAQRILTRVSNVMDGFVNDRDFVDLLRVTQLALDRTELEPEKVPAFHDRMLAEFPSGNGILNRELSRIIGYLKDTRVTEQIIPYLQDPGDSDQDKLQVILNFQSISDSFTSEQRMAVISFIESMKSDKAAAESNYNLYLSNILETWSGNVNESQVSEILRNGARWPSAALSAFYQLPDKLTDEHIQLISDMDRQLTERTDSSALQARIGCIAVLGRSADEKSMEYLREIWRNEVDRRNDVVLALAQQPEGANWPYLISSLSVLSDDTAGEVLDQLSKVNQRPMEPKFFKDTILVGFRLREAGSQSTNQLLQHWTGKQVIDSDWQTMLHAWAKWFNEKYPEEQPISFEDQEPTGNYSVDQVLSHIETSLSTFNMHQGMAAFSKAQCIQCHRFNGQGEAMGPDLNSLAKRFSKREAVRSILHPSEVISSQYQGKKIVTIEGKQIVGLVSDSGNGSIHVLTDQGEKLTLADEDIEEMRDAEVSAMPEGLLDEMSMEEISQLVNYLYSGTQKTADSRNAMSGSTR